MMAMSSHDLPVSAVQWPACIKPIGGCGNRDAADWHLSLAAAAPAYTLMHLLAEMRLILGEIEQFQEKVTAIHPSMAYILYLSKEFESP